MNSSLLSMPSNVKKWAKIWALGATVAVAVVVAVLWLRGDGTVEGPDGTKYKEVTAERTAFRLAVSADGLVRPIDRIELKSKASGEVIELPIEVGDRVEQGALIAKLDQVEERTALVQAQAELDIARAELVLAEKNFERRQQLFKNKVIAREAQDETELDLAVARSRLVQATTALERAQERMEDSVISAPVSGVILQKYVEKGQIIASGVSNVGGGTPIADIAAMDSVHIEAGVDEIDIGKIRVGQAATIQAEAYLDPDSHIVSPPSPAHATRPAPAQAPPPAPAPARSSNRTTPPPAPLPRPSHPPDPPPSRTPATARGCRCSAAR